MTPNDIEEDPLLAALRDLRTFDVSPSRARRLRARCLTRFQTHDSSEQVAGSSEAGRRRRTLRGLAAAWCIVYVVETIRRAAAVYGF